MAMFFTSHKNKYNKAADTPIILPINKGKQDGGYIYPKTEGGGGEQQPLVGNSATTEKTFKILIGISKINNFTFKC
jgi:hypothetical protein